MKKTILLAGFLLVCPAIWAVNYVVTDRGDSGPGTLRQAVFDAYGIPGLNTITFNLSGNSITVNSAVEINSPVIIDGGGTQVIGAVDKSTTIIVLTEYSGNCEIRNLALVNSNCGVNINSSNNHVYGCRIGTDWQDHGGMGNITGIYIANGSNNLIGGLETGQRNIISGNNYGIDIYPLTQGTRIQNNFIGVNSLGTIALPNTVAGIQLENDVQNILIGGNRLANEGNLISDFISIAGSGNTVCGNVIGLNAAQTAALPNSGGISLGGADCFSNFIGLPQSGYENIIAGNGFISIGGGHQNIIQNNWIGFNASGKLFSSNGTGIVSGMPSGNLIGGTGPNERNYICEKNCGIQVWGSSTGSDTVVGNWIGMLPSGVLPVPTPGLGIGIELHGGCNNHIERNVVFGSNCGIDVEGSSAMGNTLVGNWIGVLPSGSLPAVQGNYGILIEDNGQGGPTNNFIGINGTGTGNLIANVQTGVAFSGANTQGNGLYGNTICAFSSAGILLQNGASASNWPTVSYASSTIVAGTVIDPYSYIEVFRAEPHPFMAGGSLAYVGATTADDHGNWSLAPPRAFASGDYVCALATYNGNLNNTSLFSVNQPVFVPTPTVTPTFSATPTVTLTPTASPTPLVPTTTPTSTPPPPGYNEHRLRIYHSQINPLKGELARIRWYQPQDAGVMLVIYNLLGDKVATLADNRFFAGDQFYEVFWDGRTSSGKVAGSGIYIVYIQSGDYKAHAKAAVIK